MWSAHGATWVSGYAAREAIVVRRRLRLTDVASGAGRRAVPTGQPHATFLRPGTHRSCSRADTRRGNASTTGLSATGTANGSAQRNFD